MENKIKKILVIEDNEIVQEVLTRRLKKAGYTFEQAVDGEAGLRMIVEIHPAIVLLDMNLPIMDGWKIAQNCKANPLTKMIPLIALTAHNKQEDLNKALNAGCDDCVAKPIDYEELLKKIEHYLKNSRE